MHLRCKYCAAVQPVTVADEADEDLRTQGIRRTFRAEHLASCGEGAVSLEIQPVEATRVDPEIWNRYLASVTPPDDVRLGGDGFFTRTIQRDGQTHNVRVCEYCWDDIPRYVHFPQGLVSPESDGGEGVPPKIRPGTVDTDSPLRSAAVEHLWRAACLPCYLEAFARMYPGAALPELPADVVGDGTPVEAPPPVTPAAVGHVTMSRADGKVSV